MRYRFLIVIACAAVALALLVAPNRGRSADPYVGSQTCEGCHDGMAAGLKETPHRMLFSGDKTGAKFGCEACHGPGEEHIANPGEKIQKLSPGKAPAAQISKTCLKCHSRQSHAAAFRKSAHFRKGVSCADCHKVHGKGHGEKLLAKKDNDLCLGCHEDKIGEINSPYHHPIEEGKVGCADCHSPHGNNGPTAKSYEKQCVKCHTEKAGPFKHEHTPVLEGCTTCHSPHGAVSAGMLNISKPALCLQCHAGDMAAVSSHDVTDASTNQCTQCHYQQIHGWN